MQSMAKYLTEAIGAFFLVLTIGATVSLNVALAPLAIGSILMAMVFAGGAVSGAHYNPAVTLAVFLRGRLPSRDVLPYMASQVLGAVLASLVTIWFVDRDPAVATLKIEDFGPALLAEFLFTFALCWVVLNVATSSRNKDNGFYGIAIGFTVLAGAAAVGAISGGAFNPAVAVGISIMDLASWNNIWIYLLAQFLAAAAAAGMFKFLNPDEVAPV